MLAGMRPRISLFVLLLSVLGCSAAAPLSRVPDARDAVPVRPPGQTAAQAAQAWEQADAVLQKRCVVCHGCYDAPCQLKLESFPGVVRGATTVPLYDTTRLGASSPTRLGIDAHLVSEWRAKDFHAVLPEAPLLEAKHSVLLQMLELKRAHPLEPAVDFSQFTFELDRKTVCIKDGEIADFTKEHPLWGMPYALPGLESNEHMALQHWVEAGAPKPPEPQLPAAVVHSLEDWEAYLNETPNKRRLIARYVYEHLFLASLYFNDVDDKHFFRVVRSRTPPGFPVDEIATRRPFEDPGDEAFYYRFVRRDEARLNKTHMPYALSKARLARYRELFDTPDYQVEQLPSYALATAANPMRTFTALPTTSRYQFLLDDAEFFMMGFIKGPVCRGQVALNVIQERFWIAFLKPKGPFATKLMAQLPEVEMNFEMPAQSGSNALPFRWSLEAEQHARYVKARNELWTQAKRDGVKIDFDLLWDGDGHNSNAALTVLRHFDSATVVRGFVGGPSKTTWVVDYPMFERIHYLLVAGFDVFGNVGHQVMTRLYMDFLRMEGESNYLTLLPIPRRQALTDFWYKGVKGEAYKRVVKELAGTNLAPDMRYKTQQPELELADALDKYLAGVSAHTYAFAEGDTLAHELAELQQWRGAPASALPELSFLEVEVGAGKQRYFTIVRDSAHTNVAQLFAEDARRVYEDDQLRVFPGFLGAYPNALFHVGRGQIREFVQSVGSIQKDSDYNELRKRFGVLRNSSEFWRVSDRMVAAARADEPLTAGIFDYNRLQAP
ncbi:MAG: hypothetical protein RL701_3953 [Pseudomonadota bacterium]